MLDGDLTRPGTKMISRDLWVNEKTVKFHLTNIYRKLGVHNDTGAMHPSSDSPCKRDRETCNDDEIVLPP